MKLNSVVLTLVLGLVAYCPAMRADSYTLTPISYPGSPYTQAYGMNNAGEIVGQTIGGGFVYSNGIYTLLNVPGSTGTLANGVNNVGQIVGDYESNVGSQNHAFLYSGGAFTSIGDPDVYILYVPGINDAGTIVGTYASPGIGTQAFVYANGVIQPISAPGSTAWGINNAGQILVDTGSGSFLDTNGVFTPIQVPGATSTHANAINNVGQIVGSYQDASNVYHLFLDTNGIFTTLDFSGIPTDADIYGINDAGQILLYAPTTSFLATPVATPEPASLWLCCCGLVIAGTIVGRRRKGKV